MHTIRIKKNIVSDRQVDLIWLNLKKYATKNIHFQSILGLHLYPTDHFETTKKPVSRLQFSGL